MAKRFDPTYSQICGYIPKELARKFKVTCATREINQSEALEQMITTWLEVSPPNTTYTSLAELVDAYWDEMNTTRIPRDRLEAIRNGAKPSPVEQVYIGSVCGEIELVVELSEKISHKKRRKATNEV